MKTRLITWDEFKKMIWEVEEDFGPIIAVMFIPFALITWPIFGWVRK